MSDRSDAAWIPWGELEATDSIHDLMDIRSSELEVEKSALNRWASGRPEGIS